MPHGWAACLLTAKHSGLKWTIRTEQSHRLWITLQRFLPQSPQYYAILRTSSSSSANWACKRSHWDLSKSPPKKQNGKVNWILDDTGWEQYQRSRSLLLDEIQLAHPYLPFSSGNHWGIRIFLEQMFVSSSLKYKELATCYCMRNQGAEKTQHLPTVSTSHISSTKFYLFCSI